MAAAGFQVLPDYTALGSEDYVEVLIDTADFQTGNKNKASFVFNDPVQGVIGFRVLEASIPFTWYVVNSTNNQFNYKRAGAGSYTVVTIPPGNYDKDTIATTLVTLLNTADASTTFSVLVDKTTNYKLVITNTTNDFVLDFSLVAQAGDLLGFVANGTYSSASLSLTSPNVCNFTGAGNVFLKSDLGAGAFGSIKTTTLGDANTEVIATVPVTVNPNSIINWQNPSNNFFTANDIGVNKISVWFTQGTNVAPLDFHGNDYWVKLALVKRKKNTYAFAPGADNKRLKRTFGAR